jgi:hypothetical protein
MRNMRNAYEIVVGKSKGERLLGKSRHRWEDNSKNYIGRRGL